MTSSEQQPRGPQVDGESSRDAKQHPPTNSTEALESAVTDADVTAADRERLAQEYEDCAGGGPYPTYADLARHGFGSFTLCSLRAVAGARIEAEALASTYREENARLREGLEKAEAALERIAHPEYGLGFSKLRGVARAYFRKAGGRVDFSKQALTTPRTETDQ